MARIFSSSFDLGIFIWQNICFCLLDLLQKPQNWHLKGKSGLEDRRTQILRTEGQLEHLFRQTCSIYADFRFQIYINHRRGSVQQHRRGPVRQHVYPAGV